MAVNPMLRRLSFCGLLVFAGACARSPTAPQSESTPLGGGVTLVNGWTMEPVAGASVSANGTQAFTDARGHVQIPMTGGCIPVNVTAAGFLERRTCAASNITLWPVRDNEERDATHLAAFRDDRLSGSWWSEPSDVALAEIPDPELQAVWRGAAEEIQQRTLGRASFRFVDHLAGDGMIIAPLTSPAVCSNAAGWPIETAGFCIEYTRVYSVDRINVLPSRLGDGSVALRALLSWTGAIRPHPAQGLLNNLQPARELSEFEQKTLHMIGLRPVTVIWPDLDEGR